MTGVKVRSQEARELDSLIHFWKDSLAEHRLLMSPSTIYLVEQTINRLQALKRTTKELNNDASGKAGE